jgi:hypothetical protein
VKDAAGQLGISETQDGRKIFRPLIAGWILDDLEPLVQTYLAGGGFVPITLLVHPRYVPLFRPPAQALGIHVRGEPRCAPGQFFLVDRFHPELPLRIEP